MESTFSVYILTNKGHNVFYVGVTNNLVRRVYEHKNHLVKGFTDKYNVTKLVYYESTSYCYSALRREKQLKKWSRIKKMSLISQFNHTWDDLYYELIGEVGTE